MEVPRDLPGSVATITVSQASRVLGIGRGTAYELARQGKLPGALRLGHRIVVSRKALEAFLDCRLGGADDVDAV